MGKLITDNITRQLYCVSTSLLDVSNVNASTTFATYNCINTSTDFNEGGFVVNQANGITVPVSGLFLICYNCYMFSSADRENVLVTALISGIPTSIGAHGYIRDHDSHRNSSVGNQQIAYLTAGQKVNLAFQREADTGTCQLIGTNSHLAIAKIN